MFIYIYLYIFLYKQFFPGKQSPIKVLTAPNVA